MVVLHVFLIVQMAPNRAKHHILEVTFGDNSLDQILNEIVNRIYYLSQRYNLHQHSHCVICINAQLVYMLVLLMLFLTLKILLPCSDHFTLCIEVKGSFT